MLKFKSTSAGLNEVDRQRGVGRGLAELYVLDGRLDKATMDTVDLFMDQIRDRYPIIAAFLYGSRARGTHNLESDVDLAIVLEGSIVNRFSIARDMARTAFHVMMETGLMIEAFPLSVAEFEHPEQFPNPRLIETIRRDGIKM
jgi:hypothetical protein